MDKFRAGHKKKRLKFHMSPDLVVEANREMKFWQEEENHPIPNGFSESDLIRILARREVELRKRGYPGEWIEKDLKKLAEAL